MARAHIGWLVALVGLVVATPALAHKPTVTTFTYFDDIYPIFEAKCGGCHRDGGVAPMSLLTYDEAYPWAVSIKNEVLGLTMPPWSADERYGEFRHDGRLSAEEMDTIVDWCLGGSPSGAEAAAGPEGDGAASSAWSLGAPDLLLEMAEPVVLDADTSELVVETKLDTELAEGAIVRAFELRPGAASVLRSATLFVEGVDEPLGTWLPGQAPGEFPAGYGRRLPSGAALSLRLHYKKTWLDDGTPVEDRSELGLYLVDAPEGAIDVVTVRGAEPLALAEGGRLVAILPRLDAPVEALVAELVRDDGTREPLLRLREASPEWPRKYWLAEPLRLPAGSRIELSVASSPGTDVPGSLVLDVASRAR